MEMPSSKQGSSSKSIPYDMGNIHNWIAEQFQAKLAEWNTVAPANYNKVEMKSIYLETLSQLRIDIRLEYKMHQIYLKKRIVLPLQLQIIKNN